MFAHLGWRKIGGKWVYLHGDGAIGPVGPVSEIQVQTSDSRLSFYTLPGPPVGDELTVAVRASLSALELAPARITFPLLAATYRAPLGEAAVLDLSVFIAGPTGAQKTELTAIAQAHFGSGFHGKCLPGNWATTANGLEKQAFLAKDGIFTVDDFAPSGTTADVQRLHRDADRLIRGQGNRAGRGRMRPDGTLRPEYFPRGIVVSSGEDIPRGQSLRCRALILEMSPGEVDLGRLTTAQDLAGQGVFAQSMAAYIQWLAPQIETLKVETPIRLRELRAKARCQPHSHDRTPDILASLAVGWEAFLRFAHDAGVVSEEEQSGLWKRCWQTLLEVAEAQAGFQADEEPTARFISLLGSAIATGQAYVADAATNQEPQNAAVWGWQKRTYNLTEEWQPKGALVGWLDDDDLLLDPDAAFAAAQRLARDQGGGLTITAQTLWKRMHEQGKLASRDQSRRRNTVRKIIGARRRYVIHILAETLSAKSGPSGPTGPHPRISAAPRAEKMGHFSGHSEKVAHESGPAPQETGGPGPVGPVGPQREHKGQLSDETFTDAAAEAENVDIADDLVEDEDPGTQQPAPAIRPPSPSDEGKKDLLFILPSLRRDKPEEQPEPADSGKDEVDEWSR